MTTEQPDIARLRELLANSEIAAYPSTLEGLMVPAADLSTLLDHLTQSEAEIARLKGEVATAEADEEHYLQFVFVDPGANPAISWKDRAQEAEAKLATAVEVVKSCHEQLWLLAKNPATNPWVKETYDFLCTLKDDSPAERKEEAK